MTDRRLLFITQNTKTKKIQKPVLEIFYDRYVPRTIVMYGFGNNSFSSPNQK